MKLSEEEKEDITDMVIESRDVEEDLTTVYLKGYADAEEKYRKKIKELETKQKEMCEEYCPKTERIKELEEENGILEFQNKQVENYVKELKKYNKTVSDRIVEYKKNSIPKQKVKDKIEEINEDEESKYYDTFLDARDIYHAIKILEELLEDK